MAPQKSLVNSAVEITLDGRAILLRFRSFALIEYRKRLNRDLMGDIAALVPKCERLQKMRLGDLVSEDADAGPVDSGLGEILERMCEIVWIAALDQQPEITLGEVQRLISLSDLPSLTTQVLAAFVPTLPPVKPGAVKGAPGGENPMTAPASPSNGFLSDGASSELDAA